MTELRIRLKRRELDYLWRNRDTFFTPTDSTYIGQLVRFRFLDALTELEPAPPRSHKKRPVGDPAAIPDPYADEPEEDA